MDPGAACGICCEALNLSTRRRTTCAYCDAVACAACVKRYLVTVDDPECMTCRRPWTPDMVDTSNLGATYVFGPLKRHREDVLLARERQLLPATQEIVRRRVRVAELDREIAAMVTQLNDARDARDRYARGVGGDGDGVGDDGEGQPKRDDARQFVRRCPADGCNGYLSTGYKCGLCATKVCPTCLDTLVGAVHVCDRDAIATAEAIRRDCKPCPACGTMIHRIEGCNQMYCTAPGCDTAFCYKTLRLLDAARVHNPHLYAFRQSQAAGAGTGAGASGDNAGCRPTGWPTVSNLTAAVLSVPEFDRWTLGAALLAKAQAALKQGRYGALFTAHRAVAHMADVTMRRYPAAPDIITPAANVDLRIKFLSGAIDEARFKAQLQAREKARRRSDAVHQVMRMAVDIATGLFDAVVQAREGVAASAAIDDAISQLAALDEYAATSLRAVAKRYNCTVPTVRLLPQSAGIPPTHTHTHIQRSQH